MSKTFSRFGLAALVAAVSMSGSLFAQAPLSTTTPVTQDFNAIGDTAAWTMPANWRISRSDDVRTPLAWSTALTEIEANPGRVGGNNISTTAGNGFYNFGTDASDRALGFISSGTGTKNGGILVHLANNTGEELTGLGISFDIEKYRRGSNPAGYKFQLYHSTDGSNWSPAGSAFRVEFGPDADNTGFDPAPGAVENVDADLALTIPNGSDVYLQWVYSPQSGTTTTNSQGLGLDNVSILGLTGEVTAPPPVLASAYAVAPDVVRVVLDAEPSEIAAADFALIDSQGAAAIATLDTISGTTYDLNLTAALTDALADTVEYIPSESTRSFIGGISELTDVRSGTIAFDEVITVDVTVTAVSGNNVAAQTTGAADAAGTGILFFDSGLAGAVSIGDEIRVAGTTSGFTSGGSTRTQLANPLLISGDAGTVIEPTVVPAADFQADNPGGQNPAEQWEGVLIRVNDLEYVEALSFNEHEFEGPGGELMMTVPTFYNHNDDLDGEVGEVFDIIGIGFESFGFYKIAPRSADDIVGVEPTSVEYWHLMK